jgi:hypothetical protein
MMIVETAIVRMNNSTHEKLFWGTKPGVFIRPGSIRLKSGSPEKAHDDPSNLAVMPLETKFV